MSAYLCDSKDFALLAAYALKPSIYPRHFYNISASESIDIKNAEDLALILAQENIKSLEYRYPKYGPAGGMLCGSLEEFLSKVKDATKARYDYNDLVTVKKVLSSYNYQACEHPDYFESDAYHLVRGLKDQLLDEFEKRYELAQGAA
tara:strand:- start:357 stop:797 length:441 start_codon:yes stop_codon:yes gene_type:complete